MSDDPTGDWELFLDRERQRAALLAAYESPIERDLGYLLWKYLAPGGRIECQRWLRTPHGNFRADFHLEVPGRRVVVECDGRDFHDDWRDEWRDAIVLGYGLADAVVRVPGAAIWHATEVAAHLIATLEPAVFSEIGRTHLERLASLRIAEGPEAFGDEIECRVRSDADDDTDDKDEVRTRKVKLLRRDTRQADGPGGSWRTLAAFAREHPGRSIDELIRLRTGEDLRGGT